MVGGPVGSYRFLCLNQTIKPFDDVRVRRALTLALDRWNGSKALSRIAVVKEVAGIQVPGVGQPILFMADKPMGGGYPQIAAVIQADIPLAAQCLPGDWLRFQVTSHQEARESLNRMMRDLRVVAEHDGDGLCSV